MKVVILCLSILLLRCDGIRLYSPGRVEAAYISDSNLIADGCEDHVRLAAIDSAGNSIQYKPTAATLPIYRQALTKIPATPNTIERAVTVRFVETGHQVELLCGWGYKPKVGEIEILEITPR